MPILCSPQQAKKANPRLVTLISEARRAQALADQYREDTADELAARLNRNKGYFMRLLRLNYLAPDIVAAIHDGTQRTDLTRKFLINADLPLDWALQRQLLRFPEPPPIQTCDERY